MRIRFLLVGGLNFLVTNLTLQLLLLLPALPTIAAAAASQLVNAVLGFFLYGSQVFAEQSGYASPKKGRCASAHFPACCCWPIRWGSISLPNRASPVTSVRWR
jgi:putative flippase GtrA